MPERTRPEKPVLRPEEVATVLGNRPRKETARPDADAPGDRDD
jgi:hypothetical protein